MLERIGAASTDELFDEIAPSLQNADLGAVADGIDEMTMLAEMSARARQDETGPCFLGAGCYDHHISRRRLGHRRSRRVHDRLHAVSGRGQPRHAAAHLRIPDHDGFLDRHGRFQRIGLRRRLGARRGGAAVAVRATQRGRRGAPASDAQEHRVALAGACHPLYGEAAANIARNQGVVLEATGFAENGTADLAALEAMKPPLAVVVQQPNFFGLIEPVDAIARWARANGALTIAVVNPLALAVLKPPGEWGDDGADIACGDGQPLGIPMASGGPSFGFICTRQRLVRQLPGRIAGRTVDRDQAHRLRAHPAGAGTAHSPWQGDVQHLHQSGPAGHCRDHSSRADGRRGPASGGDQLPPQDAPACAGACFHRRRSATVRRAVFPRMRDRRRAAAAR